MSATPLFIPLRAEHFEAFAAWEKTTEYRAYGPRWNERTCWPGRPVVLSLGYGKRHRLIATVKRLDIIPRSEAPAAARTIYPACERFAAIVLSFAPAQDIAQPGITAGGATS
jgi:hypothetical protein